MILSSGEGLTFFWVVVIVRTDHLELNGGLSWFKVGFRFCEGFISKIYIFISKKEALRVSKTLLHLCESPENSA